MPALRLTGASRRLSLAATATLAGLLCGLVAYWAMQLAAPRVSIAPSGSLVDQRGAPDTRAAGRLFGVPGGAPAQAGRIPDNIKVIGVIASTGRAAVVLQVNDRPAAPYGVGQAVDGGLTVKSVGRDEVVLERDGEELRAPSPPRYDPAVLSGASPEGAPPSPVAATTSQRPALPPRPLPPSGAQAAVAPAPAAPVAGAGAPVAAQVPGGAGARAPTLSPQSGAATRVGPGMAMQRGPNRSDG